MMTETQFLRGKIKAMIMNNYKKQWTLMKTQRSTSQHIMG